MPDYPDGLSSSPDSTSSFDIDPDVKTPLQMLLVNLRPKYSGRMNIVNRSSWNQIQLSSH